MKKSLNSDWLRAVWLKSNTSAKSVILASARSVIPVKKRNTSANYKSLFGAFYYLGSFPKNFQTFNKGDKNPYFW